MTNQLTPLQCPGCGGLLRSLDVRVWQCAYCESRYILLGEETPVPGLARVVDEYESGNSWYQYLWDPKQSRDSQGRAIEKASVILSKLELPPDDYTFKAAERR